MVDDVDVLPEDKQEPPMCAYCNRNVKKSLKVCKNCNKVFHNSCLNDRHTTCTVSNNEHNLKDTTQPYDQLDTIEEIGNEEETITIIKALQELIKAKDQVICEQAEVIKCKNEIIELLKNPKAGPPPSKRQSSTLAEPLKQTYKPTIVTNKETQKKRSIPNRERTNSESTQESTALREMQTMQQGKMTDIINLDRGNARLINPKTNNIQDSNWTEIVSRRRNQA